MGVRFLRRSVGMIVDSGVFALGTLDCSGFGSAGGGFIGERVNGTLGCKAG